MFARLTRSSVALRVAKCSRPAFVNAPYVVSKNTYSSLADKSEKEKLELRNKFIHTPQLELDAEVENVKFPQGLNATLHRILTPLLHYAYRENNLDKVHEQLQELAQTTKDPLENDLFLNTWQTNPESLDLEPVVQAVLEQLEETKTLKKLPEICEAFSYVYRQLSNKRVVRVILPNKPSSEEIDLLENELKAFYYKDPNVKLTLQVSVNPDIGAGRIYCFDDNMLDLTTTNFIQELKTAMDQPKSEYSNTVKELTDLLKKPLNYDLKPSNTIYKEGLEKYTQKVFSACGFVAS